MLIDTYRFAIIGPGRLGSTLLAGLADAGLKVSAVGVHADDDTDLAGAIPYVRVSDVALEANAWWLTVPDDEIFAVAGKLASAMPARRGDAPLAIHSSGLGSVELLKPLRQAGARVLCLHPLQTFSGEPKAEVMRDVPCAVTAHEERACSSARSSPAVSACCLSGWPTSARRCTTWRRPSRPTCSWRSSPRRRAS